MRWEKKAATGKGHFQFSGTDEVGKFWVVYFPERYAESETELVDVVFEADVFDMLLQLKGGLEPEAIKGIFKSESAANNLAQTLLKEE